MGEPADDVRHDVAVGLDLAAVLALVSLFSIGGGPRMMAPLSHELVGVHGWMTGPMVTQLYGFSRFLPGAGGLVLLAGMIGWNVAGSFAAAAMPLAVLLPAGVAAFLLLPSWHARVPPAWRAGLLRAVAPVSAGQGVAGGLAILQLAGQSGRAAIALALLAAAARSAGMPAPLVLAAGGAAGVWLFPGL
ncbi:chromate transporter [Azospirillum picis]|uniref:Chromate transporter n=1 Tax=Azospirillum picis TaxID=488438 RepID=A0ABU0MQU5_9PROT|nr:chromate transporter [Azospirillum picis]MBP2302261.1 chromate transporter [Azospirillum picis]MDQ0535840.1 chromate transporter [Azospirillum picis]